MLKLKWCADLKAESDFRAMNIPFSKTTIRLSQIDLKESSFNGARLGDTIIDDLVEDYAQGIRNGDIFPSPVAYKAKDGKYVLTSGNQRCHAVKQLSESGEAAKDPAIEAYELTTSDKMLLEAIARAANVSHGSRTTRNERLSHAVYMVNKFGMSIADAALLYMIGKTAIGQQIKAEKVRKELGEQNIDSSGVPNATLRHLDKLSQDSGSFTKIGNLVSRHKPTGDCVKQIVNRIGKARSDTGRMKVAKEFERQLSEEAKSYAKSNRIKKVSPKAIKRPRRDKVISSLGRLADFLDFGQEGGGFQSLDELQIATASDEERVRKLWDRLELRMKVLLKKR